MRALLIVLILVFEILQAKAQSDNTVNINSQKKNSDYYNKVNSYFNRITEKGEISEFEKLRELSEKGISLIPNNDLKKISGFQFFIGMAYKVQVKRDSGIYYLQNSIENAKRCNDLELEITAIQQINYFYRYLGELSATEKYIKRLNVLNDQVKDVYLKDKIISALSDDYLHRGAYTKAIDLILGSLGTKESIYKQKKSYKTRINLALAYSDLGSLYLQLNQNKSALYYLKKGEPYFYDYIGGKIRLCKKMLQCYLNLSKVDSAKIYYDKVYAEMVIPEIYMSSEDLSGVNRLFSDYYLKKKDIVKARYYANISYKKGIISESNEEIFLIANMMGNLLYEEKKYKEAITYFKKELPNAKNFNKEIFANINLKLAESYGHIGNNKKAYLFYNKYSLIKDSINVEKSKEEINVIEFKYRNAQKEQQIELLSTKSKAQSNQLLQQRKTQFILAITAILTFIIAVLVYLNYRGKKRSILLLDKKNQQLDILNQQLLNANQTKTKLFSIISHDLRSPVSKLFSFLRLQQNNNLCFTSEEQDTHKKRLMHSANTLLLSMEDLLAWSKSQMDNFEVDLAEIDLKKLLANISEMLKNQVEEKDIEIVSNIEGSSVFLSDENILTIIIRNLLQNAVNKAYPSTHIIIEVINTEDNKKISVKNNGEHLSPTQINDLLLNAHIKSKNTGFGLVIVRELIEKLGGELSIDSIENNIIFSVNFLDK